MKKMIARGLCIIVVAVIVYMFIRYAWVGAEYQIERAVHFGKVDNFVAVFLTGEFCSWIFQPRKNASDAKN